MIRKIVISSILVLFILSSCSELFEKHDMSYLVISLIFLVILIYQWKDNISSFLYKRTINDLSKQIEDEYANNPPIPIQSSIDSSLFNDEYCYLICRNVSINEKRKLGYAKIDTGDLYITNKRIIIVGNTALSTELKDIMQIFIMYKAIELTRLKERNILITSLSNEEIARSYILIELFKRMN